MLIVFIDADGCAVREETYKVADRYKLQVILVANKPIPIPMNERTSMQLVPGGFDSADDWIAENIGRGDILITSDILLADRVIKKQARVLGPKGRELNEDNIGNAVGGRELSVHLRDLGNKKTGPTAMGNADRSQFLSKLDHIINSVKKTGR
jgi:uncharacterized protein YaiI (UPF0178 family)